jgi:hypothetical protein
MVMEAAESGRRRPKRQGFRAAVAIVTAVVVVAAVLLLGGGALRIALNELSSELPPKTRRITSPDGRTDLVLTWRGGGGAAGWTEESVGLEPYGTPTGGGEELATFDPEAFVGARWLSNRIAEIQLGEAIESGSLPATVHVGGKVVTLKLSAGSSWSGRSSGP